MNLQLFLLSTAVTGYLVLLENMLWRVICFIQITI